jgi:hypothetical protein
MEPTVELLTLPSVYGKPSTVLDWDPVYRRLEAAERYHPDTIHQRNLRTNQNVALHLEDAMSVVIVEGEAVWLTPTPAVAKRLAGASNAKYGYGATAKT